MVREGDFIIKGTNNLVRIMLNGTNVIMGKLIKGTNILVRLMDRAVFC